MTPDELLAKSSHVLVGVIEKHERLSPLLFRVTGEERGAWAVIRMKVRIELVARGSETRPVVDVYEVFPTGGASGDWNSTQDGGRYVIPVRLEDGRYRVTGDFFRSIYPVRSGRHLRLPSHDSRPLWERIALLQWWVAPDRSSSFGNNAHIDPARALGSWRLAKILRGLLRHPDQAVRLAACENLLFLYRAQDECWGTLAVEDRQRLNRFSNMTRPEETWQQNRRFEARAFDEWDRALISPTGLRGDRMDDLRLFTTISQLQLRGEFCRRFRRLFPHDTEHGCPADRPPPAAIVTENGDVPLYGAWPAAAATSFQPTN